MSESFSFTHRMKVLVRLSSAYLMFRVCVGSKSGLLTSSNPAARASSQPTSTWTLRGRSWGNKFCRNSWGDLDPPGNESLRKLNNFQLDFKGPDIFYVNKNWCIVSVQEVLPKTDSTFCSNSWRKHSSGKTELVSYMLHVKVAITTDLVYVEGV